MKKIFDITPEQLIVGARVEYIAPFVEHAHKYAEPQPGVIKVVNTDGTFEIAGTYTVYDKAVPRANILAMRLSMNEEYRERTSIRGQYGRSSKVTFDHITHRIYEEYHEQCEFCVKEAKKSEAQKERQRTRENGRYSQYFQCDCGCGKKVSETEAAVIPEDGEEPGMGILCMRPACARKYLINLGVRPEAWMSV